MRFLGLAILLFALWPTGGRAQDVAVPSAFPVTVSCRAADKPLDQLPPKGLMAGYTGAVFHTSDMGDIPEFALVEMGMPLKYAMAPDALRWCASTEFFISTQSFPYTETLLGDYTAEDVWKWTPAFHETFASPEAMANSLRHLKLLIDEREATQ